MSIPLSRRHFTGALGAGVLLSQAAARAAQTPKGPNDQVVLGMIGVGSQGTGRLREFLKLPDVRIAAICDVDKEHAERAAGIGRVLATTLEGEPAGEIIDLARKTPANLIAISTHGRSGIGRWLLGSVAERVLQHSGDPVLLIRAGE